MPDNPVNVKPALEKRDFYLMPMFSILTCLTLLLGSELITRLFIPVQEVDYCQVAQTRPPKDRPNCTERIKAAEGPWVTLTTNNCGYRTKEPCGPKPAGTIRIALIGSSVAQGWLVSYNDSFATRTAFSLSNRCRKPVEVQNLGHGACGLNCIYRRTDEALALKPDVLLLTFTASDIDRLTMKDIENLDKPMPMPQAGIEVGKQTLFQRLKYISSSSRAVEAAEHYLFQDASTYLRMALLNRATTGFMRPPYLTAWQEHLRVTDILLSDISAKARAAGVPFVLVPFPSAAQAAAVSLKSSTPGIDPDALNEQLAGISAKNDIKFINPLNTFRKTPGANRLYYVVNGHLNGEGQALVSTPLVDQMTEGPNPIIPGCSIPTQHSTRSTF